MSTRFSRLETLVAFARQRARRGLYDGRVTPENMGLMRVCTHHLTLGVERFAIILFTRDTGHHTSGWWKNPDYERCFHLSISYRATLTGAPLDHDQRQSEIIARAFYDDEVRKVWIEGPYSPEGKARDVFHYRLFCDPSWAPLLPRGEVYSTDWTPADWRSFSDVHGYTPTQDQAPFLLAASE